MVHLVNRQRKVRIPARKALAMARRVLRGEGRPGMRLLLAFVDDREIRGVNRRFLGRRAATDVIAFRYEAPLAGCLEAEVVISAERARAESRRRAVPLDEELLRYVAHGVLHVLGWDDAAPRRRKAMWARQEYYLSRPPR